MGKYVGKSLERVDANDKVMGRAMYPDDIEFENMAYAKVVRSSIPYGKVIDIDYSKAKKMDGVIAIIDYKMIPNEIKHGVVLKDQPILVKDIVKRVGDPILLIVAENKRILEKAILSVDVKYDEYKGIFSIEDALKDDAPILGTKSNILYDLSIKKGNIEEGFKDAKYIAENYYYTPNIDHAFLQPEACIGRYNKDGVMEIYVATQYPHYDLEEIQRAMNFEDKKINVINTAVGGAFGAREDISVQIHIALAVYYTKRPVKIVYSREESTVTHCKRHAMKMYYKTGAREDGKLCAVEAKFWGDTGAYCSWGMNVLRKSAVHATGPYEVPNVDIESLAIYTNNSFCGAMRGFGAAQATVAYESQMDILAEMLNINPLKFRYMNCYSKGSITATGQCMNSSVGIKECIEKMASLDGIKL